ATPPAAARPARPARTGPERQRSASAIPTLEAASHRRRPMARFTEEEDSPNFYLSLSDLMCLLLVFFVLIFSLTDPGVGQSPAPRTENDQAPAAGAYRAAMPSPLGLMADPMPIPEVTAPATRLGLVAVASAGQSDPGLLPQAPSTASGGPAAPAPAERGLFIDRSLLTLVTASEMVPPEFRPQEEPSLGGLLSQVQAQMAAAGSAAQGMEVEKQTDRLVLRLPEAISFDLGKAEIKPAMGRALARLATVLAQRRDMAVVVNGHTDDLPISTQQFASNWELSAARAAAVARALIAQGLDENRVTIRGLADQNPRVANHDEVSRQQNRRVEIELRPLG
ncbi:MAG: OmpA family protein, partial [Pseudomonadota bacterium]